MKHEKVIKRGKNKLLNVLQKENKHVFFFVISHSGKVFPLEKFKHIILQFEKFQNSH
jgi:hypothetical protein